MSLLDAAYAVLSETDEPLNYRVITQRILERDPQATSAKKPWEVVGRDIREDIRKDPASSRFRKDGRGVFAVNEAPSRQPSEAPQQADGATLPQATSPMSFLDAAEKVLREVGHGESLHYEEVTKQAIARGFLKSKGRTPAVTLSARVGDDIRQREARGEPPRFTRPRRGYIGLAEPLPTGLAEQIDKHNSEVRAALLSRAMSGTPREFEELVAALLSEMGFDVALTPRAKDGGYDVRGTLVVGKLAQVKMAGEAKRWKKRNVSVKVVRELRGTLVNLKIGHGLIVTTSDFSKEARLEAPNDAYPIELVNGEELAKLLAEHGIGVEREQPTLLRLIEPTQEQAEPQGSR